MKNIVTEIRKSMDILNSTLDIVEEIINELEDKYEEIVQ